MSENKYQNGKIYKIWSLETDEIYVGSTCQPLHKRMHKHREAVQYKAKNYKLYQEMQRTGQQAFKIELVENYPCNSKDELVKREGYFIRELKATLNMRIAGRTEKEWKEDNKEHMTKYMREYNQKNADKLKEQRKEYCRLNHEKMKEWKKEHYRQNADKIRQLQSEEHICSVCGSTYTNRHKARHEKTQKHLKALAEQGTDD